MTLPGALADAVTDVRTRAIDRLAYAHDASHYLLTPQAVVAPRDAAEVGRLFAAARRTGVPLTFRSGGTSLSGQAVTDGVLVDTRRHFRDIEVLDDGARVRVQPGRHGPAGQRPARRATAASSAPTRRARSACTIGGVVANNSSGMACGTARNTYRTLESLVLVLPSGTVVDTGAAGRRRPASRALEPELHDGPRPAPRPGARRTRTRSHRSSSSSR